MPPTIIGSLIYPQGSDDMENGLILLGHGDGGSLTHGLIEDLFCPYFSNEMLDLFMDAAILPSIEGRMAITTDSFVVDPLFFPGGDIGRLAICGTVNDLAVSGAHPQYLTASFIIEEGLEISTLERVVASMSKTCSEAGVQVVAGDTKVVSRGQADKLFINTSGFGWLPKGVDLGYHRIMPGDLVVVSGHLGEHGIAIIAERHGLDLKGRLASDSAPLNGLISKLIPELSGLKLMRDLTRGGFGTAVKEIALSTRTDIWLEEGYIPISPEVKAAAEILGLDPLYLANEGKFLAIVAPDQSEELLEILHGEPLGSSARILGQVRKGEGNVYLRTTLGGTRALHLLSGRPLPRIC